MTAALFILRAKEAGFTFDELDRTEIGLVFDAMIERGNDSAEYNRIATQEDFDNF